MKNAGHWILEEQAADTLAALTACSAGADGSPGGPGPAIDVALSYVDSARAGRLVLARVAVAGAAARSVLFDPAG